MITLTDGDVSKQFEGHIFVDFVEFDKKYESQRCVSLSFRNPVGTNHEVSNCRGFNYDSNKQRFEVDVFESNC